MTHTIRTVSYVYTASSVSIPSRIGSYKQKLMQVLTCDEQPFDAIIEKQLYKL